MRGTYAKATKVSSERSKVEVERILRRYGAEGFMYGWDGDLAVVAFRIDDRTIKIRLPLPGRQDFSITTTGRERSEPAQEKLWEQASRQRWRALVLIIKAKLEAIECGIATFEDEFLAYMVLPTGQTIGEISIPQLDAAYKNKKQLKLLPGGK
jgi:hypothetical protein